MFDALEAVLEGVPCFAETPDGPLFQRVLALGTRVDET
jgi:hypothetical protein